LPPLPPIPTSLSLDAGTIVLCAVGGMAALAGIAFGVYVRLF
jgi:hypothetical protein